MDKNYDDGLVHSHNWAAEPVMPAKQQSTETAASTSGCPEQEHLFDDGLVHCHDWARS